MTKQEQDELNMLRAENAALKASRPACTLKMSEKGCITMTGIRHPYGVSFYLSEWDVLFSQQDNIRAFGEANKAELTRRSMATRQAKAEAKAVAPATPADKAQIAQWQAAHAAVPTVAAPAAQPAARFAPTNAGKPMSQEELSQALALWQSQKG